MSEIRGQTERILPVPERRVHERRRVSLAYIDLGENNGGIVLNVSEGGLAVTAVEVLHGAHLPKMRFQLPHSKTHIEARGQITWTGESKREVGVRFVDLSTEATTEIRTWIASEFAGEAATAQQQYPSERDAGWRESYATEEDLRSTGMEESEPSEKFTDASSERTIPAGVVTHTSVRRPFTAIMAPEMMAREPAAPELSAPELRAPELAAPEMSMPEPFVPSMPTEEMRAQVPVVQLTMAEAAPETETAPPARETAGPVAETAGPVAETAPPEMELALLATETAVPEPPPVIPTPAPAIEEPQIAAAPGGDDVLTGRSFTAALQKTKAPVESAPPVHSGFRLNDEPQIFYQAPRRTLREDFGAPHRRWWALTALISLFAVISFVAGMAAGGGGWDGVLRLAGGKATLVAGEPEKAGNSVTAPAAEAAAGGKPDSAAPEAESTAAQPTDGKSGARGSASERTGSSPIVRPGDKENSSIVLSMPESSVTASTSIAITSRRMVQLTQESAPKSSVQGGSVQIGQLFYRVEPFYPRGAERQGIEGVVEVHAVVGRDGKVRAAEVVSGPTALSQAAVKAVREWRYKPTTVNGQPVESEVNVKMTFRLPRDKNNPK
jgi:TonB family protein